MKTKEVKIEDRTFTIKELSLEDSLNLGAIKDQTEMTHKLLEIAVEPAITEEMRKEIPMKTGLILINEINEFNGLTENFLSSVKVPSIENGE